MSVPPHLTPGRQMARRAEARHWIARLLDDGLTADELDEARRTFVMVADDCADRAAGRAPHPLAGRRDRPRA